MARWRELPEIVVEHILRTARGRNIPGSNSFARVCRQWRDAGGECEPLQLLLNLAHLSEEDLACATSWLSVHGQHVDALVIAEDWGYRAGLGWFITAAPALAQLRRLEVAGRNSLGQLAPVLQHLPQLQHLAAGVCVPAEPDLQEACPRLSSLHLTLDSGLKVRHADPVVLQWLDPSLQQLTLTNRYSTWQSMSINVSSLVHLSGLQQLTLDGLHLVEEDVEEAEEGYGADEAHGADKEEGESEAGDVAQGLAALQQLRVYHHCSYHPSDCGLVHVADMMTDHEVMSCGDGEAMFASFVHLTRLVLCSSDTLEETAAVLAAPTALQELGLDTPHLAYGVRQAADMAQLRSLQLDGLVEEPAEVAACLAQCTQLTSLVLLVIASDQVHANSSWASALQQLTGLQRLTVCEQFVAYDQGRWLAALTALTRLCVDLGEEIMRHQGQNRSNTAQLRQGYHAAAQQLVAGVVHWPVRLQQVLFWAVHIHNTDSFEPMCWQFTPSAPASMQVTAWLEEKDQSAPGWARPFRPCPHLPGVWELQGEVQSRPWHLMNGPFYDNGW